LRLLPAIAGKQKPTTVAGPWVFVEIALNATSPGGIVCYDDHQLRNLQRS